MTDLVINSVTPTADIDGIQTADVVSTWGNVKVSFKKNISNDNFDELNVDFSHLTFPEGSIPSRCGQMFIQSVAESLMDAGWPARCAARRAEGLAKFT